ncbi:tetratricopeptide repeat protein [Asanoa sp. WMMD1127]|uniref:ATP-binding protein n=1 Tax=Asanoa sp. WMMD1127 TaxID=3016107 RepID=UPI0024175BBB|nr:tetratricopeptide repeat protein [Asanoa sp. WMMD1127]MDG4821757.1 tetratricopeptide repeat protein [Asanoa sp. WMMD1127]
MVDDPGTAPLAALLRAWRERALLTQEQLAERTGLGVRTIRRLETSRLHQPHSGSLRLLADALGLSDEERTLLAVTARGQPAPPAPAGPAPPRQLPPDIAGFAGRTEQLADLDTLAARANTVVISGTAGVGKTALALRWAHRVAERFPDGQLYVNLRGFDPGRPPMPPYEAIRGFLDAFAVAPQRIPADVDARAALYRSLVAGRRLLVVLDNARDADQVRPLLPGSPGCLAVVTSRHRLTSLVATHDAAPLALDLLTVAEARDLLTRRLGPDRATGPLDRIIDGCVRLPLALAIVGARGATHPELTLDALAAELADARTALDALTAGDAATDVRAVFACSYRDLSPAAARLFRLLAVQPGPDIALPAVASLAADPAPPVAELTAAHLLTESGSGRYAFHDLLRAYAGELVETDPERASALDRLLDHYLHTAHAAALTLNPHRHPTVLPPARSGVAPEPITKHDGALAWFAAEHAALVGAIRQAPLGPVTWRLAWTLVDFLDRQGHWQDQVVAQTAALRAARRLDDHVGQAFSHRGLALAYGRLGRDVEAHEHYRHALDAFGAAGDLVGQARTHLSLASVFERQQRFPEALDQTQRALANYRAAAAPAGEAEALNAVGWCHALLGDHRQALHHCAEALALLREVGDRHAEANTWDSLGYAHHHLGDHREAIRCYREAVELFREIGGRYFEADTLTRLGDTQQAAGDPAGARETWQHALAILDDLGHADADRVRGKLAAV